MAIPRGLFDDTAVADGWFDETQQAKGWFDPDLLDTATAVTFNPGWAFGANTIIGVGNVT